MIEYEISVRFVKSLNFTNLENLGDSWGENNASWKVDHGDISCLKYHFKRQLLSQLKHSRIKSEISKSDL